MIVRSIVDIARRPARLHRAFVLALMLPLLFALLPEGASARGLNSKQASSARLHHLGAASYARPHHVWQARRHHASAASWARPHRVGTATYSRKRHLSTTAPAWRRRVAAFAAARPRLDHRAAFRPSGAGQSVIAEAMRYVGAGNVTGTRGAWCADYASMVLRRTGHQPLAGRTVSAALAYGPRVKQPKPGDLVVINTRAGRGQHVGFFAGWDRGRMMMVSGNWGRRVSVAPIAPRAIAAFIGV